MVRPDFAYTGLERLDDRDLRFVIENFPVPGRSYAEIFRLVNILPTTVQPMARELALDEVFLRLALLFDAYKAARNHMSRECFHGLD